MQEKDLVDRLISEWQRERPDLDPSPMSIVGRILSLGKTLERRANNALVGMDLIYTDLDVLATLRRSGKPYCLSPKELMKSVLITSGSMTALLNRLTRLNLITRTEDESDGRIKKASLTKKGIALIDKAIELRFNEASDAVKGLSAEDQKSLAALLRKLSIALK
jgi:DNA-binding MarR family transcriptional regulator